MASAYDCAVLSEDVYEGQLGRTARELGWLRKRSCPGRDGFYAAVYMKGGQFVLAFRGTDDVDDAIADARMGPGVSQIPPSQTSQALRLAGEYIHGNLNIRAVTGHSLGGALAKVVAQQRNVLAIAFNAPYIGDLSGVRPMTSMYIKNFNSDRDPVSGITRTIGRMEEGHSEIVTVGTPSLMDNVIDAGISMVTRVPVPVMRSLHYHGIVALREAMASQPRYRLELPMRFGG